MVGSSSETEVMPETAGVAISGRRERAFGDDVGVTRFVLEGDVEVCKEVTPPEDSSRWLGLGED